MTMVNTYTQQVMRCPYHRIELQDACRVIKAECVSGYTKAVDLCECPQCPKGFYWDVDSGEFYTLLPLEVEGYGQTNPDDVEEFVRSTYTFLGEMSRNQFPEGRHSALGTDAKQSEVSIYKKGLKSYTTLLKFKGLHLFLEHNYTGNYEGDVLSTSYSLKYSLKNFLGSWCWDTWSFLWNRAKRAKQRSKYTDLFSTSLNRAWPYKVFETFLKVRFYNLYKNHGSSKIH